MRTKNKKLSVVSAGSLVFALIAASAVFGSMPERKSAAAETADEPWFYLSDFAPESGTTGWDGSNMIAVNGGLDNGLAELWLSSGDASGAEYENNRWAYAVKFKHGISVQATGLITYDISDMGATRFTCKYGANTKHASGKGTVGLQIYTDLNDGDTLYSLDSAADAERLGVARFPIGQYDKYVTVDVEIPAGANTLYIKATDGGNGNDSDHAVIADPKLYAQFADLSGLEGKDVSTGWDTVRYDSTPDGPLTLKTVYKANHNNNNIVERNIEYGKGLFLHAASSISFDIDGMGIKRFTSFYGISELQDRYIPTSVFKVFFDGAEVFSGEKTRGNVSVAQGKSGNIDLDVPAGTKKITLTTAAKAGSTNDGNHTLWVCPRLFGDNLDGIKKIYVDLDNPALTVGDTTGLEAHAVDFRNIVRKIATEELTLTTDSDKISISSDGKITAAAAGEAVLTAEYNGFTQNINITVFAEDKACSLSSPSGSSVITVVNDGGKIKYSAVRDGASFLNLSEMGLVTGIGDFTDGMTLVSRSTPVEINQTYDPITGKFDKYVDHCFEQTLEFAKSGSDKRLKIVLRAYDDGVAFRYIVEHDGAFTISDENSYVTVPVGSGVFYQPNTTGKYPNTHEQLFVSGEMAKFNTDMTLPFLYAKPDGTKVLVSEAALDGSYCGAVLQSVSSTQMKFGFPEQQKNAQYSGSSQIKVEGDFRSPWRAFIVGDEQTLFDSTMIENLADPCVLDDTSWIEPGITSWSWMSGVNAGGNPFDYQGSKEVMIDYIDFAAEMGWQYYILDEGWMVRIGKEQAESQGLTGGRDWLPNGGWYIGFYDYMPEVIEYANSKNIGLIAWVHVSQINDPSGDYKQMDDLFKRFAQMGIKGIKADFFNSENQLTIELYDKIYEKLARYKLLGNMHGANKPTGERRKYPNIINREAIYGEELNSTKLEQLTIQAFTRGVVGPTDLTPYIYPADKSDTTMGSQMALGVVFESGMTCFAERADIFRRLQPEIRQYYYAYPTTWYDSKLLGGSVGSSVSVARRADDGRWYVGGVSVAGGTESVTLGFLDDDTDYTAYIYRDGADRNSVAYEKRQVVKGDTLDFVMRENGGYAVKIVKTSASLGINNDDGMGTVEVQCAGAPVTDVLPEAGSMLDIKVECTRGVSVKYAVWNGRKINVSADGEVSVMATGGDCSLKLVYEAVGEISVEMTGGGSVALCCDGRYIGLNEKAVMGSKLVLTVYPGRGYSVRSVTLNGTPLRLVNGKAEITVDSVTVAICVDFGKTN